MNIAKAINYMYPELDPFRDFEVRDDSNGKGAYLAVWNATYAKPTDEQLTAWYEAWEVAEANKPIPKTPDQLRIEQLEGQLMQQSLNSTAFMEFVLQTLGVE